MNAGASSCWGRSRARRHASASRWAPGVCGRAAATGETQRVEDVHAFPGHIACDAASASELVVPIIDQGRLIGVIDLDSPTVARFGPGDAAGMEAIARLLASRLNTAG